MKRQRDTKQSIKRNIALSRSKAKTSNASKKTNKKDKKDRKSISIAKPLKKIVDAVVQPLKSLAQHNKKQDDVDVPFAESRSSTELTTSMKFFYTNDRFVDTFDDRDLYEKLCNKWPALHESCTMLQHKRSAIIEMVSNECFMEELSNDYGMSPFDVVSFLFRMCPSLFKGIFVKKVQNAIQSTKYAKKLKKHKYKAARQAKPAAKKSRN